MVRVRYLACAAGALLLLALLLVPASAGAAEWAYIKGQVTGPAGEGIEGVEVVLHFDNSGSVVELAPVLTRADGSYQSAWTTPGTYWVEFRDEEQDRYLEEFYDDAASLATATPVVLLDGTDTTGVDAELGGASAIAGTVSGDVGAGPDQTFVTAYHQVGGSWLVAGGDLADFTGNYRVDGLTAGAYRLLFSDAGHAYLPEYYDDASDIATASDVMVGADETVTDVDASLALGGRIAGRVTGGSGEPVGGVSVGVFQWQGGAWAPGWWDTTASDGSYQVAGLSAGSYRVGFQDGDAAADPSFQPEFYAHAASLEAAHDVVVSAGSTTDHIDAALAPADTPTDPPAPSPTVTPTETPPSSATATPAQTPPVMPAVDNLALPRIKGRLERGAVLRVARGTWAPGEPELSYQWYAGTKKIAGATHRRLVLRAAYAGHRLRVRVTAEAAGHRPTTVTTRRTDRFRLSP